jgi:hypothetical protein
MREIGHMRLATMLKQPTAFLPLVMSLAALGLVVGHIVMFGIARQADEGAAAHLFQLIMALQLPVIAVFAIKWVPRHPRTALLVLAMQIGAVVAAFAPIFVLEW